MPPVMGSAAFIMAEYTGIEYRDIAIAALLPAILYYVCVYAQVHFRALRLGLSGLDPELIPTLLSTLKKGGMFFIPLIVLVAALLYGYTPTMVAIFGTLAVIFVSLFQRHTRVGPIEIWSALADTTYRMVPVAGATAAAGLVIAGLTMTGLAAKFAHVIYAITSADQFLALLIGAALTIVLGLGMPTPSAYILAAVLMGPLMNQLHIDPLPGHLFLLYFAVMSAVTPPVAVAAYAASSIAEENPMTIAGHAVKFCLAAFVVPFVFVFGPELLWKGPLWKTAITFGSAAIALTLLAAAIERYSKWCEAWWTRVLLAIGALCMIAPSIWATVVGTALALLAIGATQWRARVTAQA
jgi:TRAP transporter 4TM/12TM fusion protein